MNGKFNKEAKIGLLVILTIGIFIWGYSFLQGKRIFTRADTYYVSYNKIGGLMASADVMLNGFKIGYVDNISFRDINHLQVRLVIENGLALPEGTVARIFSSDIMGTRSVEILPGSSEVTHRPGDALIGEIEPDLREEISNYLVPLTSKAGEMMASMDSVLIIFQNILDQDFRQSFARSMSNISLTVSSLQRTAGSIDTLMTEEDSRFNRILGNLESISGTFAGSNDDISNIISNLSSVSDSLSQAELVSAVNHLNEVLSEASLLMEKIQNGEGSLGKLVSDEQLYNNLENATESLDRLLIDLRERPGRYINFSIFGRRRD
jgi:phospholipid/cholesterol/gamma-HCH transport system substrate-binding protein